MMFVIVLNISSIQGEEDNYDDVELRVANYQAYGLKTTKSNESW